jgi:hypothetical protein
MLARMTATQAKWAARVREWRESGKRAEDFAADREFEGSTLQYWASRLKTEAAKAASPPIARVVRRRARSPEGAPLDPELWVEVGSTRIIVRRGFDAELLRQVAAALGAAK